MQSKIIDSIRQPQVSVVGLGNAGQAILRALPSHIQCVVYDRDPAKQGDLEAIGAFPLMASSVSELAAGADLIILSLPTPAASLSVAREMREAIKRGAIVLETSTVKPEDVEALHSVLDPAGATVIDAAIIGGVHKLAEGQGVFLVGPPEQATGMAGEILRSMSEEIFFLNGRGDGMRAKLVANAVSHTVYVLLLEAGALAAAQNIPMQVFTRLMERESGLQRPLKHRFVERLQAGDFSGGMSTVNARKDSSLILETARALDVPLFAIPAVHTAYEIAVAEGLGSLDYASMGQLWEKWLDTTYFNEKSD